MEENLEEKIIHYLQKHSLTITTVESCTGGMVASRLVNVSGASDVFKEGYITYSESAKQKLVHVKEETIKKYNVVSTQVAEEMAIGGAQAAEADASISVTGLAGPTGGTNEIPVGTVCFGIYYKNTVKVFRENFLGTRLNIREQATEKALELMMNLLLSVGN